MAALTANGVGTCGADDNQAQAGHLIVTALTTRSGATFDDQQIGQLVVGVLGDQSHTLTADGSDASEDGTGRGTPVVAFHLTQDPISGPVAPAMGAGNAEGCATLAVAYPLAVRGRDGGADLEAGAPGDPMFALRAGDGGSSRSQLIAVHENQRGEINEQDDIALTAGGGKPGQGYPAVSDGVIVRRLTPLECERLQGFPDGWTDVDGASDSQRYRQLGNSVAVPVFKWVLDRLAAADAASLDGAA